MSRARVRRLVGMAAGLVLLAGCATAPKTRQPGAAGAPTPGRVVEPVLAGLEACPVTSAPRAVAGGLPDLSLSCLGGGPAVGLAGLTSGTPMVVNLWASWCVPCQQELPAFQRLHERAGSRLAMLGVLTKDPSTGWRDSLLTAGVRYPSVRDDDGTLLARERGVGLPMTLFVRGDGSLAMRYLGPALDDATLSALVEAQLGLRL